MIHLPHLDKESSNEHPIRWFEVLLFHEGYEDELNKFIYDVEMLEARYDSGRQCIIINEQDHNGLWHERKEYFSHRLAKKIKEEYKVSKILIRNVIDNTSDISLQKRYITNILTSLQSLISQAEKSKFNDIISPIIVQLIENIRIWFSYLQLKHKAFQIVDNLNEPTILNSYFGTDNYRKSTLKELYSILIDYDIIDDKMSEDEINDENNFVTVFSSMAPQKLKMKIKFSINNMEVSYILKEIGSLFKNFTFNTIEASKCFYNKQNKLLNRNDLDTAFCLLKKKGITNNTFCVNPSTKTAILAIRVLKLPVAE